MSTDTGPRRYRMTANGEQPVWASSKKLVSMGQEWAEQHYRAMGGPTEPAPYGNTIHDQACARRWEALTGKLPSWYPSRSCICATLPHRHDCPQR